MWSFLSKKAHTPRADIERISTLKEEKRSIESEYVRKVMSDAARVAVPLNTEDIFDYQLKDFPEEATSLGDIHFEILWLATDYGLEVLMTDNLTVRFAKTGEPIDNFSNPDEAAIELVVPDSEFDFRTQDYVRRTLRDAIEMAVEYEENEYFELTLVGLPRNIRTEDIVHEVVVWAPYYGLECTQLSPDTISVRGIETSL